MRRAEIRQAVDEALAAKGYSPGWYSWAGATLAIWDRGAQRPAQYFRLRSGISRKRFIEAIEAIEAIGPARKPRDRSDEPRMRQMDIEEVLAA